MIFPFRGVQYWTPILLIIFRNGVEYNALVNMSESWWSGWTNIVFNIPFSVASQTFWQSNSMCIFSLMINIFACNVSSCVITINLSRRRERNTKSFKNLSKPNNLFGSHTHRHVLYFSWTQRQHTLLFRLPWNQRITKEHSIACDWSFTGQAPQSESKWALRSKLMSLP